MGYINLHHAKISSVEFYFVAHMQFSSCISYKTKGQNVYENITESLNLLYHPKNMYIMGVNKSDLHQKTTITDLSLFSRYPPKIRFNT